MRRSGLLVTVVLLAAALQPSAGAEPASTDATQLVTLSVQRFYNEPTKLHQLFFSGIVSSRKPGEYVAVLLQKCGQSFSTAVAGASTRERGAWGASPTVPLEGGSGVYRARWKNEVSRPVSLRPPIGVQAGKLGDGKVRVTVTTFEVQQNMGGRIVVLQRLSGGAWSDVQRTKLAKDPTDPRRLAILRRDVRVPRRGSDAASRRAGEERGAVLQARSHEQVDVMRVRTASAALVGGAVALLLPWSGAASVASAETVTLTVLRSFDQPTRSFRLEFSGTVSSAAAGEDVTVMQQTCGYSFATAVAGTQTRAGGFWEGEPANPVVIAPSATYRARWGSEQSEPVIFRPEIPVFLVPVGKGRLLFRTTIRSVQQDMRGRIVVLQRLRAKKWTTVARKRLTIDRAGFMGYVTEFVVPKRWTVRARIPAASAAPCFKPNATEKVVSS